MFLHNYYGIDSTGWGTPFLLVPEATTVDDSTLQLLQKAKKSDLFLSKNSPLGVPFHYLKGTSSDLEKQRRIEK
jgi:NAD(P)H-dependent flavin oxidoreductase YrpB (nitropropane dioxygenase family)